MKQRPGDRGSVLLFGGFGGGNIGNEVSAQIALDLLRADEPDRRFVIATPFPAGARRRYGLPVTDIQHTLAVLRAHRGKLAKLIRAGLTEWLSLLQAMRQLRAADVVLVPGTGILDDFGERPWAMPYAMFSWAALARLLRRPFSFVAIGAGPINGRLNRVLMLGAVRLARQVSVRDDVSRRFLREAGIGGELPVTGDIAFALPDPELPPALPTRSGCVVGVGIMTYEGWGSEPSAAIYQTYVELMGQVISRLRAAGHPVRVLTGQPVDLRAVEDVLVRCGQDDQIRVADVDTFADLVAAVGEVDVVIATRYHNVVAALLADRPIISLSYAEKNAALLRAFALKADRFVEDADVDWVLARFDDIRSGRISVGEDGAAIRQGWRDGLNRQLRQAVHGA